MSPLSRGYVLFQNHERASLLLDTWAIELGVRAVAQNCRIFGRVKVFYTLCQSFVNNIVDENTV